MTALAALVWLASAGPDCLVVEGQYILARELATAVAAFAQLPADARLGYAPAPGVRRTITATELARLAARHNLQIEGRAICVERAAEKLTPGRLLAALRAALGRDDARIELVDYSRYPLPPGELEFPRAGLAAPPAGAPAGILLWRGRLRFDGNRSLPVWARVRISAPGRRLVAAANLAPDKPIEASQLRLEEAEWFPFAEQPLDAIEAAVGKLPRRWIRAGSALYARMLAPPKEVERGAEVEVEVASGGAQLRFSARAESAGRAGDVIVVRSPLNGKRIAARVEGPGKVVVNANCCRPDDSGELRGPGR